MERLTIRDHAIVKERPMGILTVVLGCKSGETHTREFEIPDEDFVQWLRLDTTAGPVMLTTMTTHTDMRGLHTVCRRRGNIIDTIER